MRALLAAKGIASDFALVNAASPTYQFHPLPALAFDHVIVYIPGLDIYTDATAKSLPFGTLPASLYDKPTLQCSERPSTTSRIPGTSAEVNNGLVTTDVTISEDGKASAVTVVEAEGPAVEHIKFLLGDAAMRGPAP